MYHATPADICFGLDVNLFHLYRAQLKISSVAEFLDIICCYMGCHGADQDQKWVISQSQRIAQSYPSYNWSLVSCVKLEVWYTYERPFRDAKKTTTK